MHKSRVGGGPADVTVLHWDEVHLKAETQCSVAGFNAE
jgi:hypothetical protein